jgi:hypothetical protein
VRARSTSRLALAGHLPVLAVVVIGAFVATVVKIGPGPGDSSAGSTDAANRPIESTTRFGDFELTIRSAKARYAVDEPIEIGASLTYTGVEQDLQIGHALGADDGPLGFGIEEPVIGDLRLTPGTRDACARTTLVPGQPLAAAFAKSAGWSGDDPRSDAYLAFVQDPVLRLGAGTWQVYAVAQFSIGDCGSDPIQMRVGLAIDVVGRAIPSKPNATTAPASQTSPSSALTSVELLTQPEPETGCHPQYHEGRLVRYPGTGLGITDDFGVAVGVVWPYGYSARDDDGVASLLGPDGQVVAREREFIGLSGPGPGDDRRIYACADVRRIEAVRSSDRGGGFELALEARPQYAEGEEIDATLTLENIRFEEAPFLLAQSPLVSLSVIEVDGDRHAEFDGDGCGPFGIYEIGAPNEMPYVLRGTYGTTAYPESFGDLVISDELRLPAGAWRLVATTRLWGAACDASNTIELEVAVTIVVE